MFDSVNYICDNGFVSVGMKIQLGYKMRCMLGGWDLDSCEMLRTWRERKDGRVFEYCDISTPQENTILGIGHYVRLNNGVVLVIKKGKGGLRCRRKTKRQQMKELLYPL